MTPSSPLREPIQVSNLEDEQQRWIDDMEGQETNIFNQGGNEGIRKRNQES